MFFRNSCFFNDPADIGNLTSGSSAFSKTSLNMWKFTVHVLLKPSLKDLSITLLACEISAVVQWFEHSLALPLFGTGIKTDLFQSCAHCGVFQICWHIDCSTLITSSFRIWNSSAGIPSPPLALFVLMPPKAKPGGLPCIGSRRVGHDWSDLAAAARPTWFHTPGYLALGEWSHYHGYPGH